MFEQLAEPVGGRVLVQYFGNSVAAPGSVWVDLRDVAAVDEPFDHTEPEWPHPSDATTWLQSQVPTELWSAEGSEAVAFTVVPAGSVFECLQPAQGTRVFAHYFGNSVSTRGDVWVDADNLTAVDAPATLPPVEPEWPPAQVYAFTPEQIAQVLNASRQELPVRQHR